ncbi:MAG TPA: HDIG domain-containing protein [Thermoanaerobaculia bacterium]|nr:HDIG domain-containing protein [Thermoanaerobaculia bacterium]
MGQSSKERRPSRTGTVSVARTGTVRWSRVTRGVKERWQDLLAWDPFWIFLFLAGSTWALLPVGTVGFDREAEVGAVASRDFVAPRDALVADAEATEEKRRRARDEVLPVYDLDAAALDRTLADVGRVFTLGQAAVGGSEQTGEPVDRERLVADVQRAAPTFKVTPGQLDVLLEHELSPAIEDRLRGALAQALGRGAVAGKNVLLENRTRGIRLRNLATGQEKRELDLYDYLDYPDDVQELLAAEIRSWSDYDGTARAALLELLTANVSPNLHLNQSETVRRQQAAAASVETVYNRLRQGQMIVRKGDQIDPQAAHLIGQLRGDRSLRSRLLPALGIFLFLALVALVLWLGIRKERVAQTQRRTVLGEALLLLLVSVLGAKLCQLLAAGLGASIQTTPFNSATSYYFAIPFAALALVTVLVYGRGLALLMALSFSLLAGLLFEEAAWEIVVYTMAGSLAAILTVDHFQLRQRSLLVRAGAVVGLVNVVTVLMLIAIAGGSAGGAAQLGLQVLCALVSGVLVSAVVSFLIPVLESVYSVTTGIKLVELANTNLPLLRRLAFEAPGTFQHSLMVANLAKVGCEAIGADSVLAYTGALYHDVGKIFRPEYFVENQRPGHNRHDKLLPSMSALILINHVKDGLELAREHHLPEPILAAIAEHHGTRVISYFYSKAKEMQAPGAGEVSEEKFRYPGPRPHNKVMGVLMLADGVEAACRSLEDPGSAKIRTVIKAITDDCLRDGQLDDTDLTLGDLKQAAEAFQHVLSHIHHRRLDYPGFDFNERRRERRTGETAEVPPPMAEPGSPSEGASGAVPAVDGPPAERVVRLNR